jgi:stage III sporulation protein AE
MGSAGPFIGLAAETLEDVNAFGTALLPVITAAGAASGAVTSSAVKYAAAALYMNVIMNVGKKLVVPLVYAYVAASGASAAFEGVPKSAAALIKKTVSVTLSLTALSFTVYVLVAGLVTSTSDAAAIRAAKTAISTVLPVVGSVVADAADTVVSGMAVLKNGVGVFGLLVTCAICAGPFIMLGVSVLVYKAAFMLAEPFGGRTAALISAVGDALSMAAALTGTGAVVLFVSIISAMRAVTG